MEEFYINQIFENEYPPEAADFCNESQGTDNPCYIKEIEPDGNTRRFQIVANESPSEEEEVKQQKIQELQRYLNETDWYAVRYAETGISIPEDIKTARQSAREEISRLREELEKL